MNIIPIKDIEETHSREIGVEADEMTQPHGIEIGISDAIIEMGKLKLADNPSPSLAVTKVCTFLIS